MGKNSIFAPNVTSRTTMTAMIRGARNLEPNAPSADLPYRRKFSALTAFARAIVL
jgi:hypothetical protein